MDFGDDQDGGSEGQGRPPKRYHRHTPHQIQTLETMFKECPHPDENQRAQLSRDLGLEARQIKFWFQNRRTQMKHDRADNCYLRSENDKIRCENIAMRESLRSIVCPNCGGPPEGDDFFDEQKLRMENARLKEELDRVASLTSKFFGRPFSHMPQGTPSASSLDLTMGLMGGQGVGHGVPSLDLDIIAGPSSSEMPFQMPPAVTEMERPILAEIATRAMDEVIRLAQAGDNVWVKIPGGDGRDTLNADAYDTLFSKPGSSSRPHNLHVEGSRDSGLVFLGADALVEVFMDTRKWMEFFPSIVSNAHTVEVLVNGVAGRNESLILMYEELHLMTPAVPSRELTFLRYCRQIDQGLWAIADVSVDTQRDVHFGLPQRCRRFPSGCLIADMSNGYSKVTWVEHMEMQEKLMVGVLYRDIVQSGAAFGAPRWVGVLQRACDRYASQAALAVMHGDIGGMTPEGRSSMMKLSQRMVSSFCESIASSPRHQWTALSTPASPYEVSVRVSVQHSSDPGLPSGVMLSAATSVWLPVPFDLVFAFVRDEANRHKWDVLTHGNQVQEVSRIPNGHNPGNCISLLRGLNASENSMLVVQESCTDPTGALVVYCNIDIPAANVVMSGDDPSVIPLLPSGFTIVPDGSPAPAPAPVPAPSAAAAADPDGASAISAAAQQAVAPAGCILTVVFQIMVSSLPSAKLKADSVATISGLIATTVEQIKASLHCP